MNLDRFAVKFFAQSEPDVDDAAFIDIFHEWIRLKRLNQVMLDVADYRHVPEGPGIMLVTHEINYAMDRNDGKFGLYAQRKVGDEETLKERILGLVKSTAQFGSLLEAEASLQGKIKLDGSTFHYIANDRLNAPNTEEAFNAIKKDLEAIAAEIYPGKTVSVTRLDNDPRARLTAVVTVDDSVDMSSLVAA
ncbi:MAG: hypothetical protein VKL39_00055 [Leptolyngbyaceae bacterium]|nr:hypothetical protein [Leptolyngbyaceae bacterium]